MANMVKRYCMYFDIDCNDARQRKKNCANSKKGASTLVQIYKFTQKKNTHTQHILYSSTSSIHFTIFHLKIDQWITHIVYLYTRKLVFDMTNDKFIEKITFLLVFRHYEHVYDEIRYNEKCMFIPSVWYYSSLTQEKVQFNW